MSLPRSVSLLSLLVAAVTTTTSFASETARSPEPRLYFTLPSQPLSAALIRFAVQARLSLAMQSLALCRASSAAVVGHLGAREALVRLLAGTGCDFRFVDAGAVLIFAKLRPEAIAVSPPPDQAPSHAPRMRPVLIQEVLVTSAQRPALLDRAAYSVSVLSSTDISDSATSDFGGLAPLVGGATLTNLGPGRNKIILRGLADSVVAGRTQSTVGLYLDGARITYNAPDPDLRLTDVERVEVLRGPQGALYGAGSVGGVVEIVTRKPVLTAFSAGLDLGAATTVGGGPSRSVDAVLNLPLITDKLGVRLVAYDELQGGFLDNPRLGLKNVNSVRRWGVRAATRWQVNSDWSATATVTHQSLGAADGQYADPLVGVRSRVTSIQEPHAGEFTAFVLSASGQRPWGDLTLTSSLVSQSQTSRFEASQALPFYTPRTAVGPSTFNQTDSSDIIVNELSATSAPKGKVRWLGGLFLSLTDNDSTSSLTAPFVISQAPSKVYGEQRRDRIAELAAYGEVSYEFAPRLVLSAGGRFFGSWLTTQSTVTQPLTNEAATFDGSLHTVGFAPQMVLRYRPRDDVTFYVQASEGYRSGGFNTAGLADQVYPPYGVGPQPWRRYGGDELWNFEAGAKFAELEGRIRVRAAAFYMLWRNIQSDQLLASGLPYAANIGDGRDVGWEGDIDFRADEHWRMRLNAAIAKPQVTSPNPSFVATPGFGLSGSWNYWSSLQATYTRSVTRSLLLRILASCSYIGGANLTLDAVTAAEDSTNVVTGQLRMELVRANWTLAGFVIAPIAGGSDTFGFGNPFSFRLIDQTTPARPTTVGLNLKVSWP